MTLVPKYIVERCDISYIDKNGNRVICKNEEAYYQAIGSNRSKDHKFYKTMQDYGDVNAAEGKQWLVLYTNKNTAAKTPILADSLKVVTGTSDKPEGYTTGIHMFGEATPVNMTAQAKLLQHPARSAQAMLSQWQYADFLSGSL